MRVIVRNSKSLRSTTNLCPIKIHFVSGVVQNHFQDRLAIGQRHLVLDKNCKDFLRNMSPRNKETQRDYFERLRRLFDKIATERKTLYESPMFWLVIFDKSCPVDCNLLQLEDNLTNSVRWNPRNIVIQKKLVKSWIRKEPQSTTTSTTYFVIVNHSVIICIYMPAPY